MVKRSGHGASRAGGPRQAAAIDRPLSGAPYPYNKLHPTLYAAEVLGTALLVFVGLSSVIAFWGVGAPLSRWPLSPDWRRFVNGLVFGSVGALIAYSPLGRISGAHINPAMTFAFFLADRLKWRDAGCYVVAQMGGAAIGIACLLSWGHTGASARWGASLPDLQLPFVWAVLGETVCTFLLVGLVFFFASRTKYQPFTPLINPPLFAVLSCLEAPLSGASANPARSFGPALVSGDWTGWWVYWIGPAAGAALAVGAYKIKLFGHFRLHQARLFHFGHPGGVGPSNRRPAEIRREDVSDTEHQRHNSRTGGLK